MSARIKHPPLPTQTEAYIFHGQRGADIELSGDHSFKAAQLRVWDVLTDPAVLRATLPGCKQFDDAGDGSYDIVMSIGIGAVKGTYTGKVRLADVNAPDTYTLEVAARGAAGFMSGKGYFTLAPVESEPTHTKVSYKGEAQVGGPVAGVGQRLVKAGATLIVGQFFRSLDKKIND